MLSYYLINTTQKNQNKTCIFDGPKIISLLSMSSASPWSVHRESREPGVVILAGAIHQLVSAHNTLHSV